MHMHAHTRQVTVSLRASLPQVHHLQIQIYTKTVWPISREYLLFVEPTWYRVITILRNPSGVFSYNTHYSATCLTSRDKSVFIPTLYAQRLTLHSSTYLKHLLLDAPKQLQALGPQFQNRIYLSKVSLPTTVANLFYILSMQLYSPCNRFTVMETQVQNVTMLGIFTIMSVAVL